MRIPDIARHLEGNNPEAVKTFLKQKTVTYASMTNRAGIRIEWGIGFNTDTMTLNYYLNNGNFITHYSDMQTVINLYADAAYN